MANIRLSNILVLWVAFLAFFISPTLAGGGCFTWGAYDNWLFDQQYIEAICSKDLFGWFNPGQRREICINTGFSHRYPDNPGSVLFAVTNLESRIKRFNRLQGCKDVFYGIIARCKRGGDFEIRGHDFHWNFVLDPNVASC